MTGIQRSDDSCHYPVHEPAEEVKASFAPLLQLVLEYDLELAGRTNFGAHLKKAFVQLILSQ